MKIFRLTVCKLLFSLITSSTICVVNAQTNWLPIRSGVLDGNTISGLYAGGMNWTKPAIVDIDGDGDYDMFIGKEDGTISFYRNDCTWKKPVWTYVTENYNFINVGSMSRPSFVDMDDDGDFDMIVGKNDGTLSCYRNEGSRTVPKWSLVSDHYGSIDVGDGSAPAFVDIDNDSDYDMFIGNGKGEIIFYRNTGTPQAPRWSLQSKKYLGLSLQANCIPFFADIDGDSDPDLFIGAAGNIVFYRNDGSRTLANFTFVTDRYANVEGSSSLNAAFVDIDDDGDLDMFTGEHWGAVCFYRNDGTSGTAQWTKVSADYFPIDLAGNSAPAFVDIDGDGDKDMFIGQVHGSVHFIRNDGDSISPRWTYGGVAVTIPWTDHPHAYPAFVDIDADGDQDLFIGEGGWQSDDAGGNIHFYRNDGTKTNPVWSLVTHTYHEIDVGSFSAPTFVDIDGDGDFDMFIGNKEGTINFYRNNGTPSSPSWAPAERNYGSIDIGRYSTPMFCDIDGDSDFDLFVGNEEGKICFYRNDGTASSPGWTFVTNDFNSIDVGSRSAPSFVDIDGDGDIDIFVGENDGGINFYQNVGDIPPYVVKTLPTPGDVVNGSVPSISVSFSEPMSINSIGASTMLVTGSLSGSVKGSIKYTSSTNTVSFIPDVTLTPGETVTVIMRADAQDLTGNGLDGNGNGISEGSPKDDFILSFRIQGAKKIYVDVSNKSGIEDGTQDFPFSRIVNGINEASSGDTIRVAEGTYNEQLTMKEGIILQGANRERTIINGNIFSRNIKEGLVTELKITQSGSTGIHIYTSSFRIGNCIVASNTHHGIGIWSSSSPTISNCIIEGAGGVHSGIFCQNSSPRIYNNVISHNGQQGIMILDHSNPTILNNTIVMNGQSGIVVSQNSEANVVNNIVVRNLAYGVQCDRTSRIDVSYNDVFGNYVSGGTSVDYAGCSPGTGDISSNPLFTNFESGNYLLQLGSPCVDAGAPDLPFNDINGTRNDMGAFGGPLGATYTYIDGPPIIDKIVAKPSFLQPGDPVVITAKVWDVAGQVNSVMAEIRGQGETFSSTIQLFDDGVHNDRAAGDHYYGNRWTTPLSRKNYQVDIVATDNNLSSDTTRNATIFSTDESALPRHLSFASDSVEDASIIQASDGKIWIVWSSLSKTNYSLWTSKSGDGGVTWSTPRQLPLEGGNNFDPSIAQSSEGKICVVYSRAGSIWFTTSSDDGSAWSSARQLVSGNVWAPHLAADLKGKLAITWSDGQEIYCKISLDNGNNWSSDVRVTTFLSTKNTSEIAIDRDGRVHIVWSAYIANWDVWHVYTQDNGASWSSAHQITNEFQVDVYPSVEIDGSGKFIVAWTRYGNGNYDIFYSTSHDGTIWSTPTNFTRFTGVDYSPDVSIISGQPWIIWISDRPVGYGLFSGITEKTSDSNPPPHEDWIGHEPHSPAPTPSTIITINAKVTDDADVENVQLVYSVNDEARPVLTMYDDGSHKDNSAGDCIWGVEIGSYVAGTMIKYQVKARDSDGNTILAPATPAQVEVIGPFVQASQVLLVADYKYEYYSAYMPFYTSALKANNYSYDVWDCYLRGEIDSTTLNSYRYGAVIWSTSMFDSYLTNESCRLKLQKYLDLGGKLFISGQSVANEIGNTGFFSDYLHARSVQNDIDAVALDGASGDPISDGLYIGIIGGDGADNQGSPDEIEPISPGVPIFTYGGSGSASMSSRLLSNITEILSNRFTRGTKPIDGNEKSHDQESKRLFTLRKASASSIGAIRVDAGKYKVVFFAFGFEGINRTADRNFLMYRIMSWLSPSLHEAGISFVTPDKGNNKGTVDVTIYGNGFLLGATSKLAHSGYEDIVGVGTSVIDSNKIVTRFDLNGRALGNWDVVVVIPFDQQLILPNGFRIGEGYVNLWTEIVGREQLRLGREQSFVIRYGNSGNVDSYSTSMLIPFSRSLHVTLGNDSIRNPVIYDPNNYQIDPKATATVEAFLGSVKAGTSNFIRCKIKQNFVVNNVSLSILPLPHDMEGSLQTSNRFFSPPDISECLGGQDFLRIEFMDLVVYDLYANRKLYVTHPFIVFADAVYTELNNEWDRISTSDYEEIKADLKNGSFVRNRKWWNVQLGMVMGDFYGRTLPLEHGTAAEVENECKKWLKTKLVTANVCIQFPEEKIFEKFQIGSNQGLIPDILEKGCPTDEERRRVGEAFYRSLGYEPVLMPAYMASSQYLQRTPEDLDKYIDRELQLGNLGVMSRNIPVVTSIDPNAKTGSTGFTIDGSLPADRNFQYAIYFENIDSATAAAEEIVLLDTLNSNLDPSTFALGSIQLGDTVVTVSASTQKFNQRVVLNDTTHVQVSVSFDQGTGILNCHFVGTNPKTGEFAGILPPNRIPPQGEGYVSYATKPKANVVSGTLIRNRASIIFDVNPPMTTNEVFNTIDALPPSSSVTSAVSTSEPSIYQLSWSGHDDPNGSGIRGYSIYCSDNGGAYKELLRDTLATTTSFVARAGHQYRFYSIAKDSVGNVELQPDSCDLMIAPTTSAVSEQNTPREFSLSQNYPNPFNPYTTINYDVPRKTRVTIKVYDVLGREVVTLVDEEKPAGFYKMRFFGANLSSGVYFCRIQAGEYIQTRKMILLK